MSGSRPVGRERRTREWGGLVIRVVLAIAVVGGLAGSSAVFAARHRQDPPAPVFTVEQASSGKAAYARACASCHMPDLSGNNDVPPLAGTAFTTSWGPRTTKELFDYMSATMPPGGLTLEPDGYLTITAYVLQFNGAGAGSQPYTSSTAVPIASLLAPRPTSGP
jgi:mono/diheme cytochrome c family protein